MRRVAPGEGMCAGTCLLEQGPPGSHNLLEEELGVATSSQRAVQLQGENKNSLDILGFGHATWSARKPHPCQPNPSSMGRSLMALLAPHPPAGVGNTLSSMSAGEEWAHQSRQEACRGDLLPPTTAAPELLNCL